MRFQGLFFEKALLDQFSEDLLHDLARNAFCAPCFACTLIACLVLAAHAHLGSKPKCHDFLNDSLYHLSILSTGSDDDTMDVDADSSKQLSKHKRLKREHDYGEEVDLFESIAKPVSWV